MQNRSGIKRCKIRGHSEVCCRVRRLRALILSAGIGSRLRPITLSTPKCLVEVCGEPILGRWLRMLEEVGCEAVLVNTHYMAPKVKEYLKSWKTSKMQIEITYEEELLGTSGTLRENSDFFNNSTGLLIHSDNFMVESLDELLRAHAKRNQKCKVTMLTFITDEPCSCGIVSIDEDGIVSSFHEKEINPPGNIANGAVYAFEASFLKELNNMKPKPDDFSTEVIPRMIGRIQTSLTHQPFIDIGTKERLEKAMELGRIIE